MGVLEIETLERYFEEIKEDILSKFSEVVLEIAREPGIITAICRREGSVDFIKWLKEEKGFLLLIDLCGVDYLGYKHKTFEERFEVVYHLFSLEKRILFRIKVRVPEDDPWQDSIVSLWKEAEWFERECFDMFGIEFKGHPSLKRLLMPENWKGYPLRKDYPLFIEGDDEWEDYKELLRKVKKVS